MFLFISRSFEIVFIMKEKLKIFSFNVSPNTFAAFFLTLPLVELNKFNISVSVRFFALNLNFSLAIDWSKNFTHAEELVIDFSISSFSLSSDF